MKPEIVMAEDLMTVKLDVLERQYVVQAFVEYRAKLIRSMGKERAGSEIWVLRRKEIDAIEALSNKFAR